MPTILHLTDADVLNNARFLPLEGKVVRQAGFDSAVDGDTRLIIDFTDGTRLVLAERGMESDTHLGIWDRGPDESPTLWEKAADAVVADILNAERKED